MTTLPIVSVWNMTDAEKANAKTGIAAKRFKANADTYMVEAEAEKVEADANMQTVIAAQLKKPDFAALVKAGLRKRAADRTYEEAQKIYAEFIGGSAPASD